jgi:DNA-binding transcriptional LysR family regulator
VELRQLRAFVAVAEEGSFTRAADRLHVVQSAVSAGIRSLERELGTRLFERSTRQVKLSDSGQALLPEARRVLTALALAIDAVAQVDHGLRGSVTLGTMQAQGMRALSVARVVAAFRRDHPGVQVAVRHVGGSLEMVREVRQGRLDLAFVSLIDHRPPGVELTPLASEAMVLACPSAHPLAGRSEIELTALSDEPFVELPSGWGTRMATDRAFAAASTPRTVAFEVNDTASLVEFVREGLAVAVLPPSLAAHAPELSLVAIKHHRPTFDTFLAEPLERRPTAAARALVGIIRRLAPPLVKPPALPRQRR